MAHSHPTHDHGHKHDHHDHDGHKHDDHDHAAHGHGHAGHSHAHGHDHGNTSRNRLLLALIVTAGFALVELIGGWWTGSLALISDAGHMMTDTAALGLALLANIIGNRPADAKQSYGYARAELIGALVNSLAMIALVVWICVEAVIRLRSPSPVNGMGVMVIAVIGLLVNVVSAWALSHDHGDLNSRAALMHVMGDLLGSVAAIAAGAVIWYTGWLPIDPILSVAVSLLILRSTWQILRQSTHELMDGVPGHLNLNEIGQALAAEPGVVQVHDLHVWNLGRSRVALSAHLVIANGSLWPPQRLRLAAMLKKRFGIGHVTLQPDWPYQPGGVRIIPIQPTAPDHHH
ncbi:cobalt-zinc-cadmium efflux system protein [Andreprevotia lacus DSM 23236]|jgi:cobalt-zinc-cadmium efflux system protein|uniref:Cobalt-zinc-cadmium efflux system protein n=1 Tax=Andreprevotia lacus DSM 23236 TaxID=1121001 RepID=A0A1W1XAD0_9NEIS|nr:cation diffusion facilitator family transporter [Andreprevotia lacus]SMC20975.1 cobalt-zinc-cadmium efflux system protein [Andreprevotia lacus DSM 23236]